MESKYWIERWKSGNTPFNQEEVNPFLMKFFPDLMGDSPESMVFVPLCGKTIDMQWILGEGVGVVGVEVSEIAARQFFDEFDLSPQIVKREKFQIWKSRGLEFFVGDYFDLSATDLRDCSAVYDRAALVALPPDLRERYVNQMTEVLFKPLPAVLLLTFEYPQEEMEGPPFSVSEAEVRRLYARWGRVDLLQVVEVPLEKRSPKLADLSSLKLKVFLCCP